MLGEIFDNIETGKLNANQKNTNGKYPFFTCDIQPYRIDSFAFDTDAILISGNGNVGHINYYKGKFNAYQRTYVLYNIKEYVNIRYIYYYLNANFKNYINRISLKGTIPYITMPMLNAFSVPIPPMRVQTEIVRILDEYTENHEALKLELLAELELRKKQYYYYREKLLTFTNDTAEFLPLGEVGEIIRGKDIQKKHLLSEGVAAIHYGQIYTHYGVYTDKSKSFVSEDFVKSNKLRLAPSGSLIVATTSENDEDLCKAVAWLGGEPLAISGHSCFIQHNLNPKFLSYFFCTEKFREQKKKFITGTKVKDIKASDLAKIIIPIPPIGEQERIVAILDKFDSLVNSISEGIPAEINLRQKQYEYYRSALLSFD